MKEKKSVFKRIKEWWQELDDETQDWLKVVGLWTVDGAIFGSMAIAKNKQMTRVAQKAATYGYIEGTKDAYKEMMKNPYQMIGMRTLEQQSKAKKF